MTTSYRCKKCNTTVPRGHRMQYCECGSIFVDWGAGGKGATIRTGWPDGHFNDWIEMVESQSPVLVPKEGIEK